MLCLYPSGFFIVLQVNGIVLCTISVKLALGLILGSFSLLWHYLYSRVFLSYFLLTAPIFWPVSFTVEIYIVYDMFSHVQHCGKYIRDYIICLVMMAMMMKPTSGCELSKRPCYRLFNSHFTCGSAVWLKRWRSRALHIRVTSFWSAVLENLQHHRQWVFTYRVNSQLIIAPIN